MPEEVAIGFAHSQFYSRRNGGNSPRMSAYNRSAKVKCGRTGQVFDYTHRPPPEHSEMRVPQRGADSRGRAGGEAAAEIPEALRRKCSDPEQFWIYVELFEKRKDAQVARQVIIALPASSQITPDDRLRMARLFADRFVAEGFVVQLDIHTPDNLGEDHEGVNWHAHLLMPTRRLCCDGLSPLKARDVHPVYRRTPVGGRVVESDYLGEQWRRVQDEYFRSQGLDIRVDPNGAICQVHLGPVRLRRAGPESLARAEAVRLAAKQAAQHPNIVAEALTRGVATFDETDVARFLKKQLGATLDPEAIARLQHEVLAHPDTWPLLDPKTGEATGRYTTRRVREQEEAAAAAAARLSDRAGPRVAPGVARAIERSLPLNPEQLEAFRYAIGRSRDEREDAAGADLKIIRGRAGTGKSFTLKAIRQAYEASGKTVIGLGPTHSVIQDMRLDGFNQVQTVQSALWQARLREGSSGGLSVEQDRRGRAVDPQAEADAKQRWRALRRGPVWTADTVLMVDEAAMMSAEVTGQLLQRAEAAGAKVILVGDERQLGSVQRGGLFGQLAKRHRSRILTKVLRQTETWQQQASRDLAEYRFLDALRGFDAHGAVKWRDTREAATEALIEAWTRDHSEAPAERRFVFAYENRYVNEINDRLHKVRRARGELVGPEVQLQVRRANAKEGEQTRTATFAVGDRIQFTATRKTLGIYNGACAILRRADAKTGEVEAQLDTASGPGRTVVWNARDFNGFDLGYAGTIYKGQGKTFAQTYLLHTERWQAGPSYVALTRQRKDAKLFVGRDTADSVERLASQMSVEGGREASLAWEAERRLARNDGPRAAAGAEIGSEPARALAPKRDRPARAGSREQLAARLKRWREGQPPEAGAVELAPHDAEALRKLLDDLQTRMDPGPRPEPSAEAKSSLEEARARLDRERRVGRTPEVR